MVTHQKFLKWILLIIELKNKLFQVPKNDRQNAVIAAAKHSWKGYKQFAWGHDFLRPLNKTPKDVFGLGVTIVDGIDTLFVMELQEEYEEARLWIEESLNFQVDKDVNVFEVTIRVLGGLLSIYHLSDDKMFLEKAVISLKTILKA